MAVESLGDTRVRVSGTLIFPTRCTGCGWGSGTVVSDWQEASEKKTTPEKVNVLSATIDCRFGHVKGLSVLPDTLAHLSRRLLRLGQYQYGNEFLTEEDRVRVVTIRAQ